MKFLKFLFVGSIFVVAVGTVVAAAISNLNMPVRYIDSATYECVAIETGEGLLPKTNCNVKGKDVFVAPGATLNSILASRK